MLLHAASGSRQGGVVRSEPMAGAPPLHRRRSVVDRQQRQRTDAPPPGDRRKNWLFLGSEQAGPRADVLFTVLAGAKRRRIEPWTYLRELLLRLHDDDPRLDDMLPDKWAANHPEAVLTYRLEESRRKAVARSTRRRHARAASPTC